MTKYTPGPWNTMDAMFRDAVSEVTANGRTVAWICRKESDSEAEANARLIAAAPEREKLLAELLEAAEAIAEHLDGYELTGEDQELADILVQKVYPAISKAKGDDHART